MSGFSPFRCPHCGENIRAEDLPDESDRRISPRFPLGSKIVFLHEDRRCEGVAENVNLGGMFIQTEPDFETWDIVDVAFKIEGIDHPFEIPAEIVSVCDGHGEGEPRGIGIRFNKFCTGYIRLLEVMRDRGMIG